MLREEITSSLQNPLGFVGKIVPSSLLKGFGIDRCFLFCLSCLCVSGKKVSPGACAPIGSTGQGRKNECTGVYLNPKDVSVVR